MSIRERIHNKLSVNIKQLLRSNITKLTLPSISNIMLGSTRVTSLDFGIKPTVSSSKQAIDSLTSKILSCFLFAAPCFHNDCASAHAYYVGMRIYVHSRKYLRSSERVRQIKNRSPYIRGSRLRAIIAAVNIFTTGNEANQNQSYSNTLRIPIA